MSDCRQGASLIGASQAAAKVLCRLLLLSAFLAVALMPSAGYSQITDCQSEKGAGSPWAWRQIDGRQCWYKGTAGMDKKLLRWADSTKASSATKTPARKSGSPSVRPPSLIDQYGEREMLLHSYWPPLPGRALEGARAKRL
jgi:hypothetical protein